MKETPQYRVTTNLGREGKYRVERLHKRRFLWWRWEYWEATGYSCGWGDWCEWAYNEFATAEEAEATIQRWLEEFVEAQKPWVPIVPPVQGFGGGP